MKLRNPFGSLPDGFFVVLNLIFNINFFEISHFTSSFQHSQHTDLNSFRYWVFNL